MALLVDVLHKTTGHFFKVTLLALFCISTGQESVRTLPAVRLLWCVLCFSILKKENDLLRTSVTSEKENVFSRGVSWKTPKVYRLLKHISISWVGDSV